MPRGKNRSTYGASLKASGHDGRIAESSAAYGGRMEKVRPVFDVDLRGGALWGLLFTIFGGQQKDYRKKRVLVAQGLDSCLIPKE